MYRFKDHLAERRVTVLFISFTGGALAEQWLATLERPYPILVDKEREIYRRYGLERSVRRTWSPRTLLYYLRRLWSGDRLGKSEGDLHQLGGDFLIDQAGNVQLAHYSQDPVDRPLVESVLAAVPDRVREDRS